MSALGRVQTWAVSWRGLTVWEGNVEAVHVPLNPAQMRLLAEDLLREARQMDALKTEDA